MPITVQARLDSETRYSLVRLMRRLGWSQSTVVREGIRLLAACHHGRGKGHIIGLGRFNSGLKDLGSGKRHLKGFGRERRSH